MRLGTVPDPELRPHEVLVRSAYAGLCGTDLHIYRGEFQNRVAFPAVPVAWYLARSTSLLYALHGAMAVFISYDIPRYWRLIRFLALAAVAHGGLVLAIDVSAGMPGWWSMIEGPCFAVTGLVMLGLMHRVPVRALEAACIPDNP